MRVPSSLARILLVLWLWLTIGFVVGTSTLLGPVRWIATACRARALGGEVEKAAVHIVILLLVAVTAVLAIVLARLVLASARAEIRFGIPLLATAFAAATVWLWMTPHLMADAGGEESSAGLHFTFGPYPDEARLRRLKQEGYTAVVPLLHPAVIPFEPRLLQEEQEAAARVGIEVIHLPMLPWVSENIEALDRIKALAQSGEGRYYVHCYLGRDRVQLVRRVVESAGAAAQVELSARHVTLAEKQSFERGALVRLDDHVFVAPYPTDEEFLGRFGGGEVAHVVSLLDPADPDDRLWIDKEKRLLALARVPLHPFPISLKPFDPDAVLEAARQVRDMRGVIVVHDFLAPGSGR